MDEIERNGIEIDKIDNKPIVTLHATPLGPKCPFQNPTEFSLYPSGCVSLVGKSGIGKTTLGSVLSGLPGYEHVLKKLQIKVECTWDPSIPNIERCGVLFQQTTLIDELTIAGNISIALKLHKDKFANQKEHNLKIKQLLDAVGLDYERDANKKPTELSGGMGRRASLALQLAQHKRVIVLDEPFTGLDYDAAISVAKELVHLRLVQHTALLLISHEPHLTKVVQDSTKTKHNSIVELTPRDDSITRNEEQKRSSKLSSSQQPNLFGTTFKDRFLERFIDYTLYSLPLIALAFCACGLAIAMLSADLLQRLEINNQVINLVDKEVRPLIKLLTGEDPNSFQMMGIRMKVNSMLNQTVPPAKASLYAIGLTKLFVLEIGPLLTALLLCGRIGGSYAGKVATMQATAQNKLLRTLGINPQWWTLWPSLLAALFASPILTMMGTTIALYLGGWVAPMYGIGNHVQFWEDLHKSLWPLLRIHCFENISQNYYDGSTTLKESILQIINSSSSIFNLQNWLVTYAENPTWKDSFIEIITYPPIYHLIKSKVYILIIIVVAECLSRLQPNLTPRGVPGVITFSVVLAGLMVIICDWGFSQLLLLRH